MNQIISKNIYKNISKNIYKNIYNFIIKINILEKYELSILLILSIYYFNLFLYVFIYKF